MRINAIRNSMACCPQPRRNSVKHQTFSAYSNEPQGDTVAFKSHMVKGAGWGALLGMGSLAAITLLSGGLAAPAIFGAYAAAGGLAGGTLGRVLDNVEKDDKDDENKKP